MLVLYATIFSAIHQEIAGKIEQPNQRTNCLNGWYQFENRCFKGYALEHTEFLSWDDANKQCTAKGARLASIHSQEELDFLVTFILLNAAYNFWIGLNDRTNEEVFQWTDGSPFNFSAWNIGEPSNSDEEDCVEMVFHRGISVSVAMGTWNDLNCNERRSYICQMDTNPSHSSRNPVFCSEALGGGFSMNDSCYHVIQDKKTWADSEDYCVSRHRGHLITIQDFTVTMLLHYISVHSQVYSALWIGVNGSNPNRWSSGWYLNKEVFSEELNSGLCGVHLPTGHYDIKSCDTNLPFVCEFSSVNAPKLKSSIMHGACPKDHSGWIDLGGDQCYFINSESCVSWYEANFQCNRRGGFLASIHNEDEVKSLKALIQFQKNVFYYIGLYRKYDSTFAWADRSTVDFEYWHVGEPSSTAESCVEFWSRGMRWNDIDCETHRAYICSAWKVSNFSDGSQKITDVDNIPSCIGLKVKDVVGVVICALLVVILLGIFIYFCRPWDSEPSRLRKISHDFLRIPKRKKPTEIVIKDNSDCYEDVT